MIKEYIEKLEFINKIFKEKVDFLERKLDAVKKTRLKNPKPGIPVRRATGFIDNRRGAKNE